MNTEFSIKAFKPFLKKLIIVIILLERKGLKMVEEYFRELAQNSCFKLLIIFVVLIQLWNFTCNKEK